jgi:DNA-binding NarL/FixJ family response regulator
MAARGVDRIRVALVDDLPAFREGLAAACSRAGLTVDQPDNLDLWARHRNTAAIVTLGCSSGWSALETIRTSSSATTVLGLVPCYDVALCQKALESGATSVAAHDGDPDDLVATLIAAVEGRVVLPVGLVATFVDQLRTHRAERAAVLNDLDLAMLRLLNKGETVTMIAHKLHMAPRTVDRHLQNMYRRMGVNTRLQAVAWAVHWRVLHPSP